MLTLRMGLFGASCSTLIFATLRMIMDGANGEVVTALTLIAGCVLFGAGAIVDRLDRLIKLHSKE